MFVFIFQSLFFGLNKTHLIKYGFIAFYVL